MKKASLYILCLLFAALSVQYSYGQQLPQFTNFMLNDYVLNPALSGAKENFEVKSDFRQQWVGITDAPVTYYLSANGPSLNQNMGYGGFIYNDVTGPTSRLGATFSYAYHAKFNDNLKLSLGVSAGFMQYTIDGSQITLHDQVDPALSNLLQKTILPDIGFGAMLRSPQYYIGFSVPQLYQDKINFTGTTTAASSVLATHYYVMGGYNLDASDLLRFEFSFMLNYSNPTPAQINLGVRAVYDKSYWLGLAYRSADAIPIMVGYIYQDYLTFGYSYDISISSIKYAISGSHELVVGIKFNRKRTN